MKADLVDKAIEKGFELALVQIKAKGKNIAEAMKRHEAALDEDTTEYTFKVNCSVKIGVNRENSQEVEVTASARWSTPEAFTTGTAKVSTHPELGLEGKGKDKAEKKTA